MLDSILAALHQRHDLQAWSVGHVVEHGAQLYAIAQQVEARREVAREYFVIEVLRDTSSADSTACGTASITLLPGDAIERAIDEAALMAGLVHNPPHPFRRRPRCPACRWPMPNCSLRPIDPARSIGCMPACGKRWRNIPACA